MTLLVGSCVGFWSAFILTARYQPSIYANSDTTTRFRAVGDWKTLRCGQTTAISAIIMHMSASCWAISLAARLYIVFKRRCMTIRLRGAS